MKRVPTQTGVVMADFRNVIVTKPWGYEYLMYDNEHLAIWRLHIDAGANTSMHCHPTKKTGLILLRGEAEVSFLHDSVRLSAVNRMVIRPGLFHSTTALSPDGATVIEVETPRDKEDLVRMEDAYGRADQPYEGPAAMKPLTDDCVVLTIPRDGQQHHARLDGCALSVQRVSDISELKNRDADEIVVVLEGGLFSREGRPVLQAGDVVSPETLNRLTQMFSPQGEISLFTIQRQAA